MQNKPQAALCLSSWRAYVYSVFSRRNHYIRGSAHNIYWGYLSTKHNILGWEPGHVGIRPVIFGSTAPDPFESWWGEALGACALAAVLVAVAFI